MHVPLARLETRYTDGRYQSGKTTIIVAGIGYSVVPFRYAAPGSIEIIDLALCPLESLSRRIPRVGQRIDEVRDRCVVLHDDEAIAQLHVDRTDAIEIR